MSPNELSACFSKLEVECLTNYKHVEEYIFQVEIRGSRATWIVELYFSGSFPITLPKAVLKDQNLIGVIPHVSCEGLICYNETDSYLVTIKDPVKVLEEVITTLKKNLNKWALKAFQNELIDEYEGFLQPISDYFLSFLDGDPSNYEAKLRLLPFRSSKNTTEAFVYGKDDEVPLHFGGLASFSRAQVINIACLHLSEPILPPQSGIFDISYITEMVQLVPTRQRQRVQNFVKSRLPARFFFVIATFPRSKGERTQILLKFSSEKSQRHPLHTLTTGWKMEAFLPMRGHKKYLLDRGGANNTLLDKHVAIIGCGSVGSEIAFMLAKAGVGNLTLVDPDTLDLDNLYRHRLGGSSMNLVADVKARKNFKVSALQAALTSDLPYIDVKPCRGSFEQAFLAGELDLSDVIVVAVGAPSENLEINRLLKMAGTKKVIFCWNEAAGVGGQSAKLDLSHACLECLYSDNQGGTCMNPFSLLEVDQDIAKNLTGCAGTFTPFSYLDSSRTAAIASKHCLEFLTGQDQACVEIWKNDLFTELKTTEFYKSFMCATRIPLQQSASCPVCSA